MPTFLFDPGHGGHSPAGKSTPTGATLAPDLLERDFNLGVALGAAARVGGALTRGREDNPSLGQRAGAGAQAAVFISVHARPWTGRGSSVYVHPQASAPSQALARELAQSLQQGGWPVGEVETEELAVLSPALLGQRTAACLVELEGPPDRLGHAGQDEAAAALARGAVRYAGLLSFFGDVADSIRDAADPIANIFHRVVDTNKLVATNWTLPSGWDSKIRDYCVANPTDGALILPGLLRGPTHHIGGWILDIQTGASAMTLDRAIFYRNAPPLSTVVHELVHVGQYAVLGPTAFLVSYFGLSAATIAWRFVNGDPINAMDSSPHEASAYAVGNRFATWYAANP